MPPPCPRPTARWTQFFIDATSGPALARELTGAAHANGRKAIMMVGGSLRAKGKYVKAEGLGGVTAWTINQGYMPATRKNPPMKALMQGVMGGSK